MRYLALVSLLIVFGLISPIAGGRTFLRGRRRHGNLGEPVLSGEYDLPKEQWFKQSLDHFNPTDFRYWDQRYYVNDTFYKKNGPVFLMIGGEGEASAKWMVEGQWIEYARQFGALCFQLEHRFYGKSHPMQDLSVKNLVFLSSEQALEDLATFIEAMNELHHIPAGSKWIAFGGSYPGSLAAWLRSKYPHLVHGAMSASGPLLAQIDFQQFFAVVEQALKAHSDKCVSTIVSATEQVRIMLRHRIGQQNLTQLFNLCDPLHPVDTKPRDVANLYETLASNFAEIVQYNKDNRKGSKLGNITIDQVCDILEDEQSGIPVVRLSKISNMLLAASGEKCLDYRYSKMIDQLKNTTWASEMAEGGRQWTYQTCTEFGFFQTSTGRPQLFSETFPAEFFVQQCVDIFGPRYGMHLLKRAVDRTNNFYGAKHIEVSNVVFVHGSIDPWHPLGIYESTNPQAPSIFINGTAHCANMYPASENDLPQLTEARKKVGEYIGEWLKA